MLRESVHEWHLAEHIDVNLRNGCSAMTTSQCPLLLGLPPL